MRNRSKWILCMGLAFTMAASVTLSGCGTGKKYSGKTEIELVQYKPEAVKTFEKIEEEFNRTHDDIHLTIESPNDAMTVLKTRFIREDNPDIIGIGGEVSYSNFIDSDMLMDISDYKGLDDIKEAYKEIDKNLEFVPEKGTYAVPYAANAAGILYNKAMFEEHGWKIPTTWNELMSLCQEMQDEGIQPFYFGFKDTWTCLAPWNAIAVDLAPADVCAQVNRGKTTFSKEYKEYVKNKLIINFDCVSDGNDIFFFPTKQIKNDQSKHENIINAFASSNYKRVHINKGFGFYPSDNFNFKYAYGVCSLKKGWFYYLDRIHTSRDIIFNEENIELLSDGVCKLVKTTRTF